MKKPLAALAIALFGLASANGLAMAEDENRQHLRPYVTLTGADSRVKDRSYHRAMSEEEWARIWQRHKGAKESRSYDSFYNPLHLPYVDFGNCMVIAIFQGSGRNSAGLKVIHVSEDKEGIVVRFEDKHYQTAGPDGGGRQTAVYGFFVLPRSEKIVTLEENVQDLRGQPPVWKERTRLSRPSAPAIDLGRP